MIGTAGYEEQAQNVLYTYQNSISLHVQLANSEFCLVLISFEYVSLISIRKVICCLGFWDKGKNWFKLPS